MLCVIKNLPIRLEWRHDPTLVDKDGNTVAMLLALQGNVDIPPEWCHKSILQNTNGYTVAM